MAGPNETSNEFVAETVRWLAKTQAAGGGVAALKATLLPTSVVPDSDARRAMEMLLAGARREGHPLTIEGTLGEGGMGIVRLGTQHSVGRKVAIKTIRSAEDNERARLKLLREAWLTASLEHPNILPVHDVTMSPTGEPQVVLKRIEGVTWEEVMFDRERMDQHLGEGDIFEHNLRIFMQVCNALSLAHSRDVVHRDIKPENVMIGRFGEVYLVDWGLALSLVEDPTGRLPVLTEDVEPAGTPAYMAPEMLESLNPNAASANRLRISTRTDIYLLGAVLHEIISGSPPHLGASLHQVVCSVLLSQPKLPDKTPASLVEVVQRCMAAEPDDRFESCEQVRSAILKYLKHRGSQRLVQGAQRRHRELDTVLERGSMSESDRQRAYHLLGAARFGYQAALEAWPDNAHAETRLQALIAAMVESELDANQPHAAAALLAELSAPPAALRRRVEAAQQENEEANLRRERLERNLDIRVGQRTRRFVAAIMGALWGLTPLIAFIWGKPETLSKFTGWGVPALSLAVGGVLLVWARDSLTGSAINRRFVATIVLLLLGQLVLTLGLHFMGVPPVTRLPMYMFLWMVVCSLTALYLEPRLAPAAICYVAAFLLTCLRPDWFFALAAAANLSFAALLSWSWRGASVTAATESNDAHVAP